MLYVSFSNSACCDQVVSIFKELMSWSAVLDSQAVCNTERLATYKELFEVVVKIPHDSSVIQEIMMFLTRFLKKRDWGEEISEIFNDFCLLLEDSKFIPNGDIHEALSFKKKFQDFTQKIGNDANNGASVVWDA